MNTRKRTVVGAIVIGGVRYHTGIAEETISPAGPRGISKIEHYLSAPSAEGRRVHYRKGGIPMGPKRWTGTRGVIGLLVGLATLGATAVPWSAAHADPAPGAVNFVHVIVTRTDDFLQNHFDVFTVDVSVCLPAVPGVTGVTVTLGNGEVLILSDDEGCWSWDIWFVNLRAIKAALDNTWTINVAGTSSSTSTFTFNADPLQDSHFFDTATDLLPADDSTDVPADVIFSWSDPTGTATPDVLLVFVTGPSKMGQGDDSILGTLNITDTCWDPPLDLELGLNYSGVFYLNFDGAGLVNPLDTSDSIEWGDSPYAPRGYPATTPLLALGSLTLVDFTVTGPAGKCPWDLDGDLSVGILDLLALLAAWGTDPGGPPDFDSDGNVGILDLLILLSNWGPCP
ncbi:MAG: hypothetical protein IH830_13685 [Planctomycetes bacterium]|nr:hypothetical protein [Planctomycetota bacterium]